MLSSAPPQLTGVTQPTDDTFCVLFGKCEETVTSDLEVLSLGFLSLALAFTFMFVAHGELISGYGMN